MSHRAIYAYAWDVAEVGAARLADEVRALGIDTVTLAGSYHAGKFLRPKGRGKVYFPEDGTAYFRTDPERYGRIVPVRNHGLAAHDAFAALVETGIAVNAWLVLLHSTRLGTDHADCTVQNCFGDRYPYSLCPSHPDVRTYATALCRDVTDAYPVVGVSLETPGFMPYVHGFHHEFALVRPNAWLDALLGLCFCAHCTDGAERAGIDARALQARLAAEVETYLASDVDLPDDMAAAAWLADTRDDEALGAFLRFRCGVVTSLVAEIRTAVRRDADVAVIPSVARPTAGAWYEGSDLRDLARAAGVLEACLYEPTVARVRADLWDLQRRVGGAGRLRAILRPGYPDLQSGAELVAAVEALRDAGVREVAFYNYGHLRPASMGWIADALQAFAA